MLPTKAVVDMYICVCQGITDTQIKNAVTEQGVTNMRQLGETLGVAQQCGKCRQIAKSIMDTTIVDESLFKNVG